MAKDIRNFKETVWSILKWIIDEEVAEEILKNIHAKSQKKSEENSV